MEWIKPWLMAWTKHDSEKLCAYYSEEMTYSDPGTKQSITSKKEFRHYLEKLKSKFPQWLWEEVESFHQGNFVCVKWRARIGDGSFFYGLDLVELKDGKIVRNEVYFDRAQMSTTKN